MFVGNGWSSKNLRSVGAQVKIRNIQELNDIDICSSSPPPAPVPSTSIWVKEV